MVNSVAKLIFSRSNMGRCRFHQICISGVLQWDHSSLACRRANNVRTRCVSRREQFQALICTRHSSVSHQDDSVIQRLGSVSGYRLITAVDCYYRYNSVWAESYCFPIWVKPSPITSRVVAGQTLSWEFPNSPQWLIYWNPRVPLTSYLYLIVHKNPQKIPTDT